MQSLRTLTPRLGAGARAFSTTAPRPLAKMQIIGRLADTPETSPTSTGQEITRFAVGVGSGPRDETTGRQTHVSWFRVASFVEDGPQRRLLLSLPKGTQVFIDAEARMDTYDDKDGVKRTQLNLLMRNFEALNRPQGAATSSSGVGTQTDEPLAAAGAS